MYLQLLSKCCYIIVIETLGLWFTGGIAPTQIYWAIWGGVGEIGIKLCHLNGRQRTLAYLLPYGTKVCRPAPLG